MRFYVGIIVLVSTLFAAGASSQKPAATMPAKPAATAPKPPSMPPLVQMYQYLMPNERLPQWGQWNTYYGGVPIDQRVLYFVTWQLRDTALQQQRTIDLLEARLRILEDKLARPVEPNGPAVSKPAEPNKGGKKP